MPQNEVKGTIGAQWDFLEPAQNPDKARTDHIQLVAAGAGTYVAYPAGQLVRQKDDGTNVFAKQGVAGYTGPARLLKYSRVVNDAGYWQYGATWLSGGDTHEGSISAYHQGEFKTQDITGLSSDEVMNQVGRLKRGNRAAGILELNAGHYTAPA